MRIRTLAGVAVAGVAAAAAVVGGVAYATADDKVNEEPTVRIVTEREAAQQQSTEDCPEKADQQGTGL
jgi:hypothetical protein